MGISITRYGGCMPIRNVHTLKTTWNEILTVLNRENDKGVTITEHLELQGSVAVMQALLDEDVSSFDIEEVIYEKVLVGIILQSGNATDDLE